MHKPTMIVLFAIASGCGRPPITTSDGESSTQTSGEPTAGLTTSTGVDQTQTTSGSTTGESDTETTGSTTVETESDTAASTSSTTQSPFITEPDGPWCIRNNSPRCSPCSTYEQNCDDQQKCTAWSDNGDAWNAHKCVDLMGDGVHGDPCTAVGSGVSGEDDCGLGHMCWDVDSETLKGTCIAFCQGTPENTVCEPEGTVCVIANEGVLNICLDTCDPLVQACPAGQGCYTYENIYFCAPTAIDAGLEGEACDSINDCNPGLTCVVDDALPSCESSSCCTPFCDLENPDCQDPEKTCVPVYAEPEVGEEHIGFCGVAG